MAESNEYGLALDEIREEELQEEGQDKERQRKDKTGAFCDVCLIHNLIAISKNVVFFLCYACEEYLCDKCFKGHESHKYIQLVGEKSKRDGQIDSFLYNMSNESEKEEKFDREKVSMVDIVNVKHGLDHKDCRITGLCGLNNTRWVVCDNNNYCIKLFNVGSNLLQKYIRLWSRPYDVTEIKIKSEPTEQGVMSMSLSSYIKVKKPKALKRFRAAFKPFFSVKRESTEQGLMSTGDMFVPNRTKPLISRLAFTLPRKSRILIIDVAQSPAVITKTIETEKQCWSIDFSGDNIFTLCRDDLSDDGYHWFVTVMSTDGVTVKNINTDLHIWSIPYLAVCPGRFYITDPNNHKVRCMNNKGKVVSHKTIAWSLPTGISVDPDTNQVYICAYGDGKLYRLDSSLESSETLFDFESVNSENPFALCLYRDKLYVSRGQRSTHGNCIIVVRAL